MCSNYAIELKKNEMHKTVTSQYMIKSSNFCSVNRKIQSKRGSERKTRRIFFKIHLAEAAVLLKIIRKMYHIQCIHSKLFIARDAKCFNERNGQVRGLSTRV